jgi:hypothetical protein
VACTRVTFTGAVPCCDKQRYEEFLRWAGHVAGMGEGRGVYRVLVGKPEGKRPLGRPRHRWEDNIKADLQEVGCGCRLVAVGTDLYWSTMRSESRCALRLRYIDLVVSSEVAVEVCCFFTVFSC